METMRNFEEGTKTQKSFFSMKKVMFGLLVLAAGGLLLGFNLELLDPYYKSVVFSWQALVIAIGLISIFDRDSIGFGIVMLGVGTVFILPDVIEVPFNMEKVFWPVIIISVGLIILFSFFKKKKPASENCDHNWKKHINFSGTEYFDTERLDENNVFGGSKKIFEAQYFKGGEVNNIFGGSEIDLTKTKLPAGRTVLELNNVFGGITLIVPTDWVIHIKMDNVMGGFVDKRTVKPSFDSSDSELVIKGACVFGGGELIN